MTVDRNPDDAGAATEVWEPWVPELFQRVRVRLSECRTGAPRLFQRRPDIPPKPDPDHPGRSIYLMRRLPIEGHVSIENDLTGIVALIRPTGKRGGHRFGVHFDAHVNVVEPPEPVVRWKDEPFDPLEIDHRTHRVEGGMFAACELVPLEAPADDAPGAGAEERRGRGSESDPMRLVRQLWTVDGLLICEYDDHEEMPHVGPGLDHLWHEARP